MPSTPGTRCRLRCCAPSPRYNSDGSSRTSRGGTGRNERKPELLAAGMIIWQVCQPGLASMGNPYCSEPVAVPFRLHACVRIGSQDHLKHCAFELSSLIQAPPWCKAGRKGNSELQVGGRPCRPVGNCQCSSAAGAGCRCRCWRSLGFLFCFLRL